MRCVCATHGHCFDGLASAVLYGRFVERQFPGAELIVRACGYGSKQPVPDARLLDGDQNAILDFRYAPLPQVGFYFDHHRTAFADEAEREEFEAKKREHPGRFVFAPAATSCTRLLAESLSVDPGLDLSPYADLIAWADTVDSARFPSAEVAVDTSEPVLRLVAVVEQFGDDALLGKLVPRLSTEGLAAVAKSPLVRERFASIEPEHRAYDERVRSRGQTLGRSVLVDLTEKRVRSSTKFAVYAAYPKSVYSVLIALLSSGVKISVGHNPWSGAPCEHDISAICARYGGGGHPMVGGIAFPRERLDEARNVARTIAEELS
ncbi:MAG TPA: hypothetical protein VLC09_21370 [Polyangiaceae bacterium]|nr:hypothetical protein [Polyangiaceae bacterium]